MTEYQGLSRLVSEMSQLRTAEGADPNVYYYGLFDNCGACIGSGSGTRAGCTVGLAADITGDRQVRRLAPRRRGVKMIGKPEETFVHEIGHTAGPPPHRVPGRQLAGQRRHPTARQRHHRRVGLRRSRTSACAAPSTHSDYTELLRLDVGVGLAVERDLPADPHPERVGPRGRAGPGSAGAGEGGLLLGAIDDGQEMWWTAPGSLPIDAPRSATHTVDFEFADGVAPVAAPSQRPAARHHRSTSSAPLPGRLRHRRQLQGFTCARPRYDSAVAHGNGRAQAASAPGRLGGCRRASTKPGSGRAGRSTPQRGYGARTARLSRHGWPAVISWPLDARRAPAYPGPWTWVSSGPTGVSGCSTSRSQSSSPREQVAVARAVAIMALPR